MTPIEKIKQFIQTNLNREKDKWETDYGKNNYMAWETMKDMFNLFTELNCNEKAIIENAQQRKATIKAIIKQNRENELKKPLPGGQLSIFGGNEII